MRHVLLGVLVIALSGCGAKKGKVESAAEEEVPTGFVRITLDEEEEALEEMYGSELMLAFAECGDLVKLEPAALMGNLQEGEIRCLETALARADRQTVKDKISRVLMADSWAKGDTHRWETIVRRHLTDIDRSDPDLCYKFALYTSKLGPDYLDETMHWVDMALENRSIWTGELHVKRVYALYKLRAVAAQSKWEFLEERFAREPSAENGQERDEARSKAKTSAREWLEYARTAGRDTTAAMQLCVSAAGTNTFCEER